jgi:hypothetical protein
MPLDRPPGPDHYDGDLSTLRSAVEDVAVRVFIWTARREPDALARKAAGEAVAAVDDAIAALHSIRGRLVTETRRSDDEAAARADELLARPRDGGGP